MGHPVVKYNKKNILVNSRKEYICVMKWLLKEKGDFGPFYIGLKADSNDGLKNMFEWEIPLSKC